MQFFQPAPRHASLLYDSYIDASQQKLSNLYAAKAMFLALDKRRSSMMDAMMVGFGVAMFLCFLGYTALCEGL
jgi:hypothetical protein